jgi:deoxyhypusine synthase
LSAELGRRILKNNHHQGNHDGSGVERKMGDSIEKRPAAPEALDISSVRTVDDLVRGMSKTAFTGRQVGEAVNVLEAMARDKDCFVVMTLAGAATVARQGSVIAELIDRGIVNAIVSTGALLAQGLAEASGRSNSRYDSEASVGVLAEQGSGLAAGDLEPGQSLKGVEEAMSQVVGGWDHNEVMCSYKLNHLIGEQVAKHDKGQRGILKSAYEKGVPVFVPAFTESELGMDFALNNRIRESTGRHKVRYDPFDDLEHFAATLLRQTRLGMLAIGGGVPDRWAQRFGQFIELRHRRLGENVPLKRYHYGVRICPEPGYRGGLAGSPYYDARFVPQSEGGRFGEVFIDGTVGLPLIVAAVLERLGNGGNSTKSKKEKAVAKK